MLIAHAGTAHIFDRGKVAADDLHLGSVAAGIVINGLPILTDDPNLDDYYEDYVIGGTGAFVIPARNFAAFGRAITAKLLREVSSL